MLQLKKIVIVDDHLLFAQGLQLVIEKNTTHRVVGIVDDLEKVLSNVTYLVPDVILLDVNVHGQNSKSVCEKLTFRHPTVKVIVISMHHEYNIIREMRKAGAKGYILKNTNQDQIFKALDKVLTEGEYFEDEVSSILSKGFASSEFRLSIKTIEFYRTSLYIKLDVKNIIQLVQKVQKMNYWNA
jgi:DNA-binding NarL/FixJ family response regulator